MALIDRPKNPQSAEQINPVLNRIQTYIKNQVRLGRKFKIKDVSEELNLSEYNMNKVLIKGTGQTLKVFIANCRRERFVKDMQVAENQSAGDRKTGVCLPCRKTGVDLLQLSVKRVRLQ